MTAERVLDGWHTHRYWGWSFYLLCLFPVLAGGFVRLTHHGWVLMDIDAVLCAAHANGQGLSPYVAHACPGLAPAAYVYAPQVAAVLAPLVDVLGPVAVRLIYVCLFLVPAIACLVWFALIRRCDLPTAYRWLVFSALTPMAFCCGNVGLVMHAGVLTSRLWSRRRWPFVVTGVLCAGVKPTFLAYLIVLLFEDRAWRLRVRDFAVAGGTGMALVGTVFLSAGVYGNAWHSALHAVALHDQPGLGWLALTAWLGISAGSIQMLIVTALFMAAMLGAGLAIAKWGDLDSEARWLLGFGIAPLLTPRLMDYDMLLIVPFAALLMQVSRKAGQRFLRMSGWLFTTVLLVGIAANMLECKAWHRTHIAIFLFASLTLVLGARLAWRALDKKKNEEGPLPRRGKGEMVHRGKPVLALFNPVSKRRL